MLLTAVGLRWLGVNRHSNIRETVNFIKLENYEWYYPDSESIDNTFGTRSDKSESIYDPCPSGWRVPADSNDDIWLSLLFTGAGNVYPSNDGSSAVGRPVRCIQE